MLAVDEPLTTEPDDAARLTGQATVGSRRGLAATAAGLVLALAAVFGLLFGIDRAAPEPEPQALPNPQPSGLVITTTVPPSRVITVAPTAAPTTLAPGDFLLGAETGLWLFFGGDATLQRLDLDNGELVDYGTRAAPVGVTGGDLVLFLRGAELVGWIPVGSPGQQPQVWKPGSVAFDETPGQLWVLDPDEDSVDPNEDNVDPDEDIADPSGSADGYGSWELIDTASALSIEQRPGNLYQELEALRPTADDLPASVAALRPGPAVAARPDALLALTDGRYEPILGGPLELLAYDRDRVLVRTCTEQSCAVTWQSRSLDAPAASLPRQRPGPDVVWTGFVAGGQWLVAYYPGGDAELIEIEGTGRARFPAGANPTMSDDGQWIAFQTDGQYVILDTVSGDEVHRFGQPAPDGPPGDPTPPGDNGLLFTNRPAG